MKMIESSEYEKQEEALEKEISRIAKKTKSSVAEQLEKKQDDSSLQHCRVARRLMEETIEMYEMGGEDWGDLVDELSKALKAIDLKD